MLDEEDPDFPNWDQDVAAVEGGYGDEDPARVADVIGTAAMRLAGRFDSLAEEHWDRTGKRSDGANFTIESFARYFIHDPIHHVHDVEEGYSRLAAS